jgi:hypothetical protein
MSDDGLEGEMQMAGQYLKQVRREGVKWNENGTE